jgi:hypothetical protein
MTRMIRKAGIVLVYFILVLVLLFLIEGLLSYVSVGYAMLTQDTTERKHTEYDKEVGWINLPNVHLENMYGRGVYLTTNSQRYRNSNDFSPEVPIGKIRIVCSGDSFTLGFGVDDDHTWCQLLTAVDKRLETVNLGQGGYGVDQAYLWYKRNETKLKHDIVLFAFITDDFMRMKRDTLFGYGKPYLTIRNGELFQENYPVPRRSYDTTRLTRNLYELQQLNTVKLLSKALEGLLPDNDDPFIANPHEHTENVVSKIYTELQQTSRANQRFLVLVYLPMIADYKEIRTSRWRQYVQAEAEKNDYFFIDVVEEMRTLPPHRVKQLFRKGGHYSAEGNRYIAEVLNKKLSEIVMYSDVVRR